MAVFVFGGGFNRLVGVFFDYGGIDITRHEHLLASATAYRATGLVVLLGLGGAPKLRAVLVLRYGVRGHDDLVIPWDGVEVDRRVSYRGREVETKLWVVGYLVQVKVGCERAEGGRPWAGKAAALC